MVGGNKSVIERTPWWNPNPSEIFFKKKKKIVPHENN